MDKSVLQIDHRVPYEVEGESSELLPDDFMLLSGSANRLKSWSCEHCENWQTLRKKEICLSCYWAYPEKYFHVAMQQVRRVDLIWQGKEIEQYEKLKTDAKESNKTVPEYIKQIIQSVIK